MKLDEITGFLEKKSAEAEDENFSSIDYWWMRFDIENDDYFKMYRIFITSFAQDDFDLATASIVFGNVLFKMFTAGFSAGIIYGSQFDDVTNE